MPDKAGAKQKERHRYIWTVWLKWIAAGLIFVVLVAGFVVHFMVIPVVVRHRVESALSQYWNGPIKVDDIDLNYFGPLYLKGLKLSDSDEHDWLSAKVTKITLANWPGLEPVVKEIHVDGLNVYLLTTVDKFEAPWRVSRRQTTGSGDGFLQRLTVDNGAISVVDAQDLETLYDNISFSATRKEGLYDLVLGRFSADPCEYIAAKGEINPGTLETDISLQIKHTFDRAEMVLMLEALNIPKLSAEGKLEADLAITGRLKGPKGLKSDGKISFDGWTVLKDDKIIASNLITEGIVKDRRLDFESIVANVCNGSFAGSLYIEDLQDQPTEFGGQVLAQKLSFIDVTDILGGPGRKATKGTVTFSYNFSGKGGDSQNLVGEGQIFLDDADITVIPIVPLVFNTVGLAQLDPLKISDAECTFTTVGPVMNIKSAHVANSVVAIKAQPGGTINLQTEQIDIYVITALLGKIGDIIRDMPIINIFANLKDRLIRLHVRGRWSDPSSKLITKEPIQDIKETTVGFLQDVLKNGGQITQETLKRFRNSSKPPEEADK